MQQRPHQRETGDVALRRCRGDFTPQDHTPAGEKVRGPLLVQLQGFGDRAAHGQRLMPVQALAAKDELQQGFGAWGVQGNEWV